MDARAFGQFLVDRLTKLAQPILTNLVKCSYSKLEDFHRASGHVDIINEIVSKMESEVDAFHKQFEAKEDDAK